jgi:predicted enzyme related to lactoylglutathione lyase
MPGEIVHFELPSNDATRAKGFWSGLFGWEFQDAGPGEFEYHMVQITDEQGGAIFASEKAGEGPIVYFDTDDIDASIARVKELGGDADEKAPVPGHGWHAGCKDTEGNTFSLWQADKAAPAPA